MTRSVLTVLFSIVTGKAPGLGSLERESENEIAIPLENALKINGGYEIEIPF
jgi:hypothetical protein